MGNMDIYDAVRDVPQAAKKSIGGGRLKGMTDINPMWRIKSLTEQFGPCGVGWYYEIVEKWLETTMAKDEITANVRIKLYVKINNEWSMPIEGIGGSMLVANERAGLYVNDECYKMALTDAISVACKALGFGANVYWQSDNTKYNDVKRQTASTTAQPAAQSATPTAPNKVDRNGADYLMNLCVNAGTDINAMKSFYKVEDFINLPFAVWEKECSRMEQRINQRNMAAKGSADDKLATAKANISTSMLQEGA